MMKTIFIIVILGLGNLLSADEKVVQQISESFLKSLQSQDIEGLHKHWMNADELKVLIESLPVKQKPPKAMLPGILQKASTVVFKKRLAIFMDSLKKSKIDISKLSYEPTKIRILSNSKNRIADSMKFSTADKRILDLGRRMCLRVDGQWKIVGEFPAEFSVYEGDKIPKVYGCLPKKEAIEKVMKDYYETSSSGSGSAIAYMLKSLCCVDGFDDKYRLLSKREQQTKGGFFGINWRYLAENQKLDGAKLKLKNVKDISETEVYVTYASPTHEISGKLKLQNSRWLFALGAVRVVQIVNDKPQEVDLKKLADELLK